MDEASFEQRYEQRLSELERQVATEQSRRRSLADRGRTVPTQIERTSWFVLARVIAVLIVLNLFLPWFQGPEQAFTYRGAITFGGATIWTALYALVAVVTVFVVPGHSDEWSSDRSTPSSVLAGLLTVLGLLVRFGADSRLDPIHGSNLGLVLPALLLVIMLAASNLSRPRTS